MKINIYYFSKNSDRNLISLEGEFLSRIKFFIEVKMICLKPFAIKNDLSREVVLKKEQVLIEDKLPTNFIILDELGEQMTSRKFATFLEKELVDYGDLNILIGGALGLSDEIKSKARKKIAISQMTLTHDFCRVLLLEQIYRAFTIIKNIKYHY